MTGPDLRVEYLSKSFGGTTVWRDVSFTLPAGEISVVCGPSGAGKTILLQCLIGLLTPDEGRVLVDGTDIVACPEPERRALRPRFGMMFQGGALFGSMTIYDNVAFPLRRRTPARESWIHETVVGKLDAVGLAGSGGRFPHEVSEGMRKRAGLTRALVLGPEILLCDEPYVGLTSTDTSDLGQLLVDINAQLDATVLICTHDSTIALTVPDNLGLLVNQGLLLFAAREELLPNHAALLEYFHLVSGRASGENPTVAPAPGGGSVSQGPSAAERGIVAQLCPSPGLPERRAIQRHKHRLAVAQHP